MGAQTLSSRAIIGEFYNTLQQDLGGLWVPQVSNLFSSDQESETYKWLGMSPQMREWVGGRVAKGFRENGITIANKTFEATLEVLVDEMRRDKTGQVMTRVRELAQRTNAHWAKLLSSLVIAAESAVCYDGQYFFDTDHVEGDSGSQSNDISNDITTTTAPTAGEMESSILKSIQAILSFVDDQGEPMNENARSFLVMVPVPYMAAAAAAIGSQIIVDAASTGGRTNNIMTLGNIGGFSVQLAVNARLTWTTKFATFRTDGETKAFIRQEEEGVTVSAIAEGSELEFKENKHQYGVKAIRNVGYGYWQRGCLVTHT
jgi:phage major head subunit gpT-like protein